MTSTRLICHPKRQCISQSHLFLSAATGAAVIGACLDSAICEVNRYNLHNCSLWFLTTSFPQSSETSIEEAAVLQEAATALYQRWRSNTNEAKAAAAEMRFEDAERCFISI